ncbi:hypothetical protein ACES2I_08895 [Bdellovibrio bacteriovorus]|uniref:hypothetical protein n=1 Tax=Bdellovibrio bacteriovorus TaxID=959 RepID=UPI0035A705E7
MKVEHRYFAVGQGLFLAGSLYCDSRKLHWIYDCGTSSSAHYLNREIKAYRNFNRSSLVNIFFLSHFDSDHINGFVLVANHYKIKRLILPLVPLWKRLLLGFKAKANSHQMHFFIDPVEYIRRFSPDTEIVLVQASSDDGAFEVEEVDLYGQAVEEIDISDDTSFVSEQVNGAARRAIILSRGGRLRFESIWEFVPFNNLGMQNAIDQKFKKQVSRLRSQMQLANGVELQRLLSRLKYVFEGRFVGSRKRNDLSLFVFSGSTLQGRSNFSLLGCNGVFSELDASLYSGDGNLSNASRVAELAKYLGPNRSSRILHLQIMHHGSKGNCCPEVNRTFSPIFCISSSQPGFRGWKNPHPKVIRMFPRSNFIKCTQNYYVLLKQYFL